MNDIYVAGVGMTPFGRLPERSVYARDPETGLWLRARIDWITPDGWLIDLKTARSGEPYAFVNFYATGGTKFDRVVFLENPAGGGYESDNHTVGYFKTMTGTGVPEPATWAMMIIGFGAVGSMVRTSRRRNAFIAA